MTSRKKRTVLKPKVSSSVAVQDQTMKNAKEQHTAPKGFSRVVENISDHEEEVLEPERNLFSKKNSVGEEESDDNEVIEDDERGEEEEDDGGEDDGGGGEDTVTEEQPLENSDVSGDDDERDYRSGGYTSTTLHTSDVLQKGELSSMSFEEIVRLQKRVGTRAYKKIAFGTVKKQQAAEPVKRLSKFRPDEISAKKPVPFLRKVVPVKKTVLRDPRFDDLSGEFRPEAFKQTYKFIDELRQQEAQMVKKKLKKVKSNVKREELKMLLKRMENQDHAQRRLDLQREKQLQFKRKQRQLVGQGHRPFYLKKSDKKKLELAEKYSELKKSGKLENFLSKKRKRNAVKDRRKLPYQNKKN